MHGVVDVHETLPIHADAMRVAVANPVREGSPIVFGLKGAGPGAQHRPSLAGLIGRLEQGGTGRQCAGQLQEIPARENVLAPGGRALL